MITLSLTTLLGCVRIHAFNPDFPTSDAVIRAELTRMQQQPAPLARRVVVLAGYRAPAVSTKSLAARLAELTSRDPADFLPIAYPNAGTFAQAQHKVIDAIDARWPSDDPAQTVEVDVVAISMGGLVARSLAASPAVEGSPFEDRPESAAAPAKRLRVRRLFTLATPHQGALIAKVVAPDPAAEDMIPGSPFLARLNARPPAAPLDFELVCYGSLRDGWVGARNTAPPWTNPVWTPGLLLGTHFFVQHDPRILADLARRLRAEWPLAHRPSPPPSD